MSRRFVIGDIHGGLRALHQCLERAGVNPEEDQLIFLGDYVDGWSESAELIQFLIELPGDHIFLKGNHDQWCHDWLHMGKQPLIWTKQGGQATIDSYIRTGYINDDHRIFFRKLHNYYIDDQNRGFVHGGFRSRKGLGHEAYTSDYYWDRDLWSLAQFAEGADLHALMEHEKRFTKHKEIFIGHTSTINWNRTDPIHAANVWNLDTGAGFSGKLTIMDVNTKEYWQSELVKELYPDEHGR